MKVVAEWGQTCGGNVHIAVAQAMAAAEAGCWAAKWQMLSPEHLASKTATAYWRHAKEGQRQRDTFAANGMLALRDWVDVKDACDHFGVGFVATPFDLDAVEVLASLNPAAIKVASGDITYRDLLVAVKQTGFPVILSTGAADGAEVEDALERLDGVNVTLLACDLVYPCRPSEANLARITRLHLYGKPVGYSDHTTGVETAMAAAGAGAVMLEKHTTLDRTGPTPDDEMGLEPASLGEYVRLAHLGADLLGDGRLRPSAAEAAARIGARRGWHAARTLLGGTELRRGDVLALRPCEVTTVPVSYDVDGDRLTEDVAEGEPITFAALGRKE